MLETLIDSSFNPIRIVTGESAPPITMHVPMHQWTHDEKKIINIDIRDTVVICSTLHYEAYHMVENLVSSKEMIDTLKIIVKVLENFMLII